jgi:hypothetical protein
MVVACLVKEIQICTELRKMAEMGLIPKDTVGFSVLVLPAHLQAEDLIKQKFEFPLPTVEGAEDPLMKGEFLVMMELMGELPGAREGKEKVDRIIDLCGHEPRGTGLQNLREAIIQTKWKYDLAMEDKQVVRGDIWDANHLADTLPRTDPQLHGEILLPHLLLHLCKGVWAGGVREEFCQCKLDC